MTDIDIKGLVERLRRTESLDYHTAADLLLEALAFKQEVSDVVESHWMNPPVTFEHLIIPKPKPDPLVEVMDELEWCNTELLAREFRAALDARGLEIRSKNDDRHHTQTSRDRCDCESKVGSV
jgi:hypothetical protein